MSDSTITEPEAISLSPITAAHPTIKDLLWVFAKSENGEAKRLKELLEILKSRRAPAVLFALGAELIMLSRLETLEFLDRQLCAHTVDAARRLFEEAAAGGNRAAMMIAGYMHARGTDYHQRDAEEALRFFAMGAEAGSVTCMDRLQEMAGRPTTKEPAAIKRVMPTIH